MGYGTQRKSANKHSHRPKSAKWDMGQFLLLVSQPLLWVFYNVKMPNEPKTIFDLI